MLSTQSFRPVTLGCFLLLIIVSIPGLVLGQKYIISSITDEPNVYVKQTYGVKIKVKGILEYYEKGQKKIDPAKFTPTIKLYHTDGNAIKAASHTNEFKNDKGDVEASVEYFTTRHPQYVAHTTEFFIPYYALRLPEGTHHLIAEISATVRDSSIVQKPRTMITEGNTRHSFSVTLIKKHTFSFKIDRIRVSKLDRKGNPWDAAGDAMPDIKTSVYLNYNNQSDLVQRFPTVKNSWAAAYADGTRAISISEGDAITVSIMDEDTFFDDLAGEITISIKELQEAARSKKVYKFGQVTELVFEDFLLTD